MAAPDLIGVYSNGSGATTTVNVPNVVSGDWLVVGWMAVYQAGFSMPTPTGNGSGTYTEIGSRVGDNSQFANTDIKAWYKDCTSSGTHSVVAADDGTGSESTVIVLHMRNCTKIDGTPTENEGEQGNNVSSFPAPGVDVAENDSFLIGMWGGIEFQTGYALTFSPPGSMTEQDQYQVNDAQSFMVASEQLTSSGNTGIRTATSNGNVTHGWAIKMFAVAGPTVTLRQMSGTANMVVDSTAEIHPVQLLSATSEAEAISSGPLHAVPQMSGSIPTVVSLEGILRILRVLAGQIDTQVNSTGDITAIRGLIGRGDITVTATAALGGQGVLAGNALISIDASAETLHGIGLHGSAPVNIDLSAVLNQQQSLSGQADVEIGAFGLIRSPLDSTADAIVRATGNLTPLIHDLSGIAPISVDAFADLARITVHIARMRVEVHAQLHVVHQLSTILNEDLFVVG